MYLEKYCKTQWQYKFLAKYYLDDYGEERPMQNWINGVQKVIPVRVLHAGN